MSEEEANESPEKSSLPPLNPDSFESASAKSSKVSSAASRKIQSISPASDGEDSTGENPSPIIVKQEAMRLYPRIQAAEKEIISLKGQIPANLNKTFLQLRQQTQELQDAFPINNYDDPALNQLNEYENQLNFEIDMQIQNAVDDFEKRMNEKTARSLRDSTQTFQFTAIPVSNNFAERMSSVESLMKEHQKRINQKYEYIEQKLNKIGSSTSPSIIEEQLLNYSSNVEKNSLHLVDLRKRISSIREQLNPPTKKEIVSVEVKNKEPTEKTVEKPEEYTVPDLTEPLNLLTQEFNTFKEIFESKLQEARQKNSKCKERIVQNKQNVLEITEQSNELESRIFEADNLCNSLLCQINDMNKLVGQDTNQKMIQSLVFQIKSVQDRISSEINNIKLRIKKFQNYQPLISMDSNEVIPQKPKFVIQTTESPDVEITQENSGTSLETTPNTFEMTETQSNKADQEDAEIANTEGAKEESNDADNDSSQKKKKHKSHKSKTEEADADD